MKNHVISIAMGLSIIVGCVFAVQYANTKRISADSVPLVCDFTKMANQSPQFIEQYLGHPMPDTKVEDGFDKPLEVYLYSRPSNFSNEASPVSIRIMFYRGKVAEMEAHFPEPLSAVEAARRTGLNLSSFQPDPKSGYMEGDTNGSIKLFSVYTGNYKGADYRPLKISIDSIARDGDTIKTSPQIGTDIYAKLAVKTVSSTGKPAT